MNKELIIIGGAKTGFNLFKFFIREGISSELFFFPNEYAEKKKIGRSFGSFDGKFSILNNNLLVTSETGFNHLTNYQLSPLSTHYFLRSKENIPEIAEKIKTTFIPEFNDGNYVFPVAVKPKESMMGKVPFKFKVINNKQELEALNGFLDDILIQPYLNDIEYCQIAVAGYFNGHNNSLIAVEQKNHYPKGISAFVVNKTIQNKSLIDRIELYLSNLNYKGFIEFEFKQNLKSKEYFLMDINPRPWGWFYFYLDSIQNFKEVFLEDKPVELEVKKAWVNTPRLGMAMLKERNFSSPTLDDVLMNNICYEPYFK